MSAERKETILALARQAGFVAGVTMADDLPTRDRFERFLALGFHADMQWLAREPCRRFAPRALQFGETRASWPERRPGPCKQPEARQELSVICLAAPYGPGGTPSQSCDVALYARGKDYHRLLRKRCEKLLAQIQAIAGPVRAKICIDSSAVNERSLAARAALGWIGRNGCLINRRYGSFVFLAEIVTDLALPPDEPIRSRCGQCRRCIDACPTGALKEDGLIDCRLCISYLTIEHRGPIDASLMERMGTNLFGCDACQLACPWNRKHERGWEEFAGSTRAAGLSAREVLRWRAEDWDARTRGSALRRASFEMFLRNAAIAAGNAGDGACREDLTRLAREGPEIVRLAAAWALSKLA